MAIRVEFYGIPRQRAGVAQTEVETSAEALSLGQVLAAVGRQFPTVAAECFDAVELKRGFIVNLGGVRFVSRFDEPVRDRDCILLLSADAGG
jgi:molybdopterin converting factor small subunit